LKYGQDYNNSKDLTRVKESEFLKKIPYFESELFNSNISTAEKFMNK